MLPGALPGFLVGLRFALAYSVLGLVAAETINANSGIGFLITNGADVHCSPTRCSSGW